METLENIRVGPFLFMFLCLFDACFLDMYVSWFVFRFQHSFGVRKKQTWNELRQKGQKISKKEGYNSLIIDLFFKGWLLKESFSFCSVRSIMSRSSTLSFDSPGQVNIPRQNAD